MESKQDKIEMLQTAIKQLIDDEKRCYKPVSVADGDKEFDDRLLSQLLSQVEGLRKDDLLTENAKTCDDIERRTKVLPESEVVQPKKKKKKKKTVKKENSCGNEQGEYRTLNEPNTNQTQNVNKCQSASQTPSLDNFNHSPQTPFIPTNPMQYPQPGPLTRWLSTPSNLQFPHHQNPGTAFSGPTPSQNQPHYPQNSQSHPVFQIQQNSNPYQTPKPTPTTRPGATKGGTKNWTYEEDLQLCRAWVKVLEDKKKKDKSWDNIGVGEKKGKLWDMVKDTFQELMNEVYGKESVRNSGGCENRMGEIKTLCSKWTNIRAKAFQSDSNLLDSESIARQMWEDENNGKPFKHMACWNVLKEYPKWYDHIRKPSDKSTPCVDAPPELVDTPLPEFSHVHTFSNRDKSLTPVTPIANETPVMPLTEEDSTSRTGGLIERGDTSTPILNGPDQRSGDNRNKQVLLEEMCMNAQHYDLDLAKKRAAIIDEIMASGEKLILAVQKLDEIGTDSVLTPNQKLRYEVRQRAVTLHKRQYAELNASLESTHFRYRLHKDPYP